MTARAGVRREIRIRPFLRPAASSRRRGGCRLRAASGTRASAQAARLEDENETPMFRLAQPPTPELEVQKLVIRLERFAFARRRRFPSRRAPSERGKLRQTAEAIHEFARPSVPTVRFGTAQAREVQGKPGNPRAPGALSRGWVWHGNQGVGRLPPISAAARGFMNVPLSSIRTSITLALLVAAVRPRAAAGRPVHLGVRRSTRTTGPSRSITHRKVVDLRARQLQPSDVPQRKSAAD